MRCNPVALALAGCCLVACGGVAREDFDERLAEALCEKYTSCGVSYEEDSCEQRLLSELIARVGLNARQGEPCASRMRYDESAAEKCLDKIRDTSCSQDPLSPRMLERGLGTSEECRFFFGTTADGEVCQSSGECGAQSACTSDVLDPSPSTCQPLSGEGPNDSPRHCAEGLLPIEGSCHKPLEQDQPCAHYRYEVCAQDLYCAQDTGVCQQPASKGAPCDEENRRCAWNLLCVNGTCKAPGRKGEACTPPSPTASGAPCQSELFCDAAPSEPGRCRELLAEDAGCRDSTECRQGLYCESSSPDSSGGTCKRYAGKGEDCSHRACDPLLYCSESSGTCKPQGHPGESCVAEPRACLFELTCTQGLCGGPDSATCP
ncbi:hypothetical protein [Hyalangium versicolor]|uniref:hypothetical protein n=1 Tax=Hyalangium versicolor TaxID=2861190 RepID=UPI001CD0339E|nr:hypothetical protein [Hyalangium versicolor]